MLGCAGAVFLGFAAMVGALAIAVRSIDFDFGINTDPGQGTDSARLPVQVTPRTDLVDGAVVTVTSSAFAASSVVGVAVCLTEADTGSRGVDACDEAQGARYAVGADGKLDATYPIPRVITVGSEVHDCAAPGTSCLVVAADASDYDRSGGQTISFRPGLGPADMRASTGRPESDMLAVLPPDAGTVAANSTVTVTASGFQPGEPVLMAHCAGFPQRTITTCDPLDADTTAMAAVMFRTVRGVSDFADDEGTVTFAFQALASFDPPFGESAADCTDPDPGCAFVIAAAADTKRSAVVPYAVTG